MRWFLKSEKFGRPEVAAFLDGASAHARIFLFGGILRDLCLVGNEGFNSDIDIVVEVENRSKWDQYLYNQRFTRNKFGGFRVELSRWKVDVWELKDTWAFVHGYSRPSITNLCDTTFFDWDGIAYDVRDGTFYCVNDYLSRVHNRILDINLEPNPNAFGNVVKALRYCERYEARLSARLARYVAAVTKGLEPKTICAYESHTSGWCVLSPELVNRVLNDLEEYSASDDHTPFERRGIQESMWK